MIGCRSEVAKHGERKLSGEGSGNDEKTGSSAGDDEATSDATRDINRHSNIDDASDGSDHENPASDDDALELSFKPMKVPDSIQEDIPLDFWEEEENEGSGNTYEEEGGDPRIIEIKDVHDGVPIRGKCIVCYKAIYENDTDLFECPNCHREAHYLCATIFITEHGICPVCSTKIKRDSISGEYIIVEGSKKGKK